MGALATISLGDIAAALRRYRPVAVAVVVLLVVLSLLPAPEHVAGELTDSKSLLDSTRADRTPAATGVTGTASTETGVPPAAPGVGDTSFSSSGDVAFSPSFSSSSDAFSGSSDGGASDAFPSSDTPAETFSGPSLDSDTTATGAPLKIVGSTWASRQAGTPLAKQGVPDGTLPVGFRAVTDDKLSFIRLSGEQKILTLVEDAAGKRETNGPTVVQLCPVTTPGWKDGEAIDIDGAPEWDSSKCVLGTVDAATGTWTFDLSSFPSPTDPKGFALVPGDGGGLDYQVTFKKS